MKGNYFSLLYLQNDDMEVHRIMAKVQIETSARHVHVTQETLEILFGKGAALTPKKDLSQPGQFACAERIDVVGPKRTLSGVSILGPCRGKDQVEISLTDTKKLGIPAVIRQSGDIAGTPGCTLSGPNSTIDIDKGVIVAKRHIHMTPSQAYKMRVKDNDTVFVLTRSYERALIYADVVVRVHKNFSLAMHVDTDEANAFANEEEPYGVIIKLFDNDTYDVNEWINEILSGIQR